MCRLKSAIILRDRVYVPDHDSHTKMLEELNIEDTRMNAETKFIRAELVPTDDNVFSPVDNWDFHVDQDILPDWYVEECDRSRMIAVVKKWAASRIFINASGLKLSIGANYYLKGCTDVVLLGDVGISRLENSTVRQMRENSTVRQMRGSSTVGEMWENSTVIIPDDYLARNVRRSSIVLCDNSTIKDCRTKTIYQSGDWKLVSVDNGGKP